MGSLADFPTWKQVEIEMFNSSMSYTHYAARTKKQSLILLSLFLSFDIFFLISGTINLTLVSTSPAAVTEAAEEYPIRNVEQTVILAIIAFFTTSLICNSLAVFGVSFGKQGLLLPWLVLFLCVKIVLMVGFVNNILQHPLNMGQFFILILLLLLLTAWRHLQVQYLVLGMASNTQELGNPETGESAKTTVSDPPPKYEDVAETPPAYDETTMKSDEAYNPCQNINHI